MSPFLCHEVSQDCGLCGEEGGLGKSLSEAELQQWLQVVFPHQPRNLPIAVLSPVGESVVRTFTVHGIPVGSEMICHAVGLLSNVLSLSQSTVDQLMKEKMPKKSGRWWFSWRRREFPSKEVCVHTCVHACTYMVAAIATFPAEMDKLFHPFSVCAPMPNHRTW